MELTFDGFCEDEGARCEDVRTVCDHGYDLSIQAVHRCTEKLELVLNCVGEETVEAEGVSDFPRTLRWVGRKLLRLMDWVGLKKKTYFVSTRVRKYAMINTVGRSHIS